MTATEAPVTTMSRHYRVAALPHADAPSRLRARDAVMLAEQAERDLRARLDAGEVPEVALIAPERSCVSDIGPDGTLTGPCFAWTQATKLSGTWIHAPHAVGVLDVTTYQPDMMSTVYADNGSVQVTGGRLVDLQLSPWLAPVADQLASRYGIPVLVLDGDDVPAPVVTPQPHVTAEDALPSEFCDELEEYFDSEVEAGAARVIPGRHNVGRPYIGLTPENVDVAGGLLTMVGEFYGLPVTSWQTALVLYEEGDEFDEHTDAQDSLSNTLDRTVSFSLLLSEPGEDFEGGELIVNGEPVPMKRGDLVGFTARTPHMVTPITSGTRLVWIAFGEVAR